MLAKGSLMVVPKKCSRSAGVKKMPPILLRTALQIEVATFPPLADVNMMHMFTVVGKHVMINRPSIKAGGIRLGTTVVKRDLRGAPIRNGHNPNMANCTSPFSLTLATAVVSSELCSDSPERRKISATPYFPMNSSGLNIPPFTPNCVKMR
jgi:hypothetical protein